MMDNSFYESNKAWVENGAKRLTRKRPEIYEDVVQDLWECLFKTNDRASAYNDVRNIIFGGKVYMNSAERARERKYEDIQPVCFIPKMRELTLGDLRKILSDSEVMIVWMRYWQDMKLRSIAFELGLSYETVRTCLSKALQKLRRKLDMG